MIKDEKIDKELQGKGVKFLPFVGDQYWYGISFNDNGELVLGTKEKPGKRVLVLGESHYCDEDLSDEELASFTRDVLDCYLDSEERYSWMQTFVKFERALSNGYTNIDSNSIWNHLMFYNYLQRPLRGTRMAGDSEDYEEAKTPFFAILKLYQPDYIIVWGRRLFDNLPSDNGVEGEYMPIIGGNSWGYRINAKQSISVLSVVHPSVGFPLGYWHEVIVEFFKVNSNGTN